MEKYSIDFIQNLINNQVEESLYLEYKSSGALAKQNEKTTEISKDVSAFANSDGGILIYGIKEDDNFKHLPKELSPVKRKEFPKEWLEQIINDKIQPRIDGIQIYPIKIDHENDVYILEIPKSFTAHQAADKRYYKRFDFLSTAMYDFEIRDILNRAKDPQIKLKFTYDHKSKKLIIDALNQGLVYANYLLVKIRLPRKIVELNYNKFESEFIEITLTNKIKELVNPFAQIATYWPPRYEPILPHTHFALSKLPLFNYPFEYENEMEYEVYCDNANPIHGKIRLCDILNK